MKLRQEIQFQQEFWYILIQKSIECFQQDRKICLLPSLNHFSNDEIVTQVSSAECVATI